QLGAEVVCLEDLTNLNLGLAFKGIGAALDPFDRFPHLSNLPYPEAGDQFFGLGERSVNHFSIRSGEPHPLTFRAGLEPFSRKQHASFDQLFVELPHFGKQLSLRHNARLRILGGFDHHDASHVASPYKFQITSTLRSNNPRSNRQVSIWKIPRPNL